MYPSGLITCRSKSCLVFVRVEGGHQLNRGAEDALLDVLLERFGGCASRQQPGEERQQDESTSEIFYEIRIVHPLIAHSSDARILRHVASWSRTHRRGGKRDERQRALLRSRSPRPGYRGTPAPATGQRRRNPRLRILPVYFDRLDPSTL